MKKKFCPVILIACLISATQLSATIEDIRWLENHQTYDLVLNPETIVGMTGHTFETYETSEGLRMVISDARDGLWRVNDDLVLYRATMPGEPLGELPGDQHTLSFGGARNILIERLDIYAHEVEEALKFSACLNVVVRNCRLISSRSSEDAADIVRGQNYIFDKVWFIGLGERSFTVKGSARFIDMIDCRFGMQEAADFREVFRADVINIGDHTYHAGDKLLPRETIPSWIKACLLFSDDRSLAVELGSWSDYDIGFINEEGKLEPRPPTADIRIDAMFTDPMDDDCDRSGDLVPVLQWHTAKRVMASGWVFNPTNTSVLGDLIEDLYYEESSPSPGEEAELRETLGSELDYWGVELPRYKIDPLASGNNRFFGALYNYDNQFLYSPVLEWFFVFQTEPPGHDFMAPGTWLYHYNTSSWYLLLAGEHLPSAWWWNASEGAYYTGLMVSLE